MSLTTIFQAIAGGVLLGGVYALLAAGLTLIFGVMRVINFAQAEFMMVGMFATYFLSTVFGLDPLLVARGPVHQPRTTLCVHRLTVHHGGAVPVPQPDLDRPRNACNRR